MRRSFVAVEAIVVRGCMCVYDARERRSIQEAEPMRQVGVPAMYCQRRRRADVERHVVRGDAVAAAAAAAAGGGCHGQARDEAIPNPYAAP